MTTTIRRLRTEDHAALRAIRLRALAGEPTAYGSTYERELGFGEQVWRERLDPGTSRPYYGGFDAHGSLVGLAAAGLVPDEPLVGEVLSMWVDPPARGTGLAAGLIAEVVAWLAARGCTTVRLWVTDGNERAEGLYRRVGFRRTGAREVREHDGLAEVEMEASVASLRSSR